ncbi:mitochondrial substrate carrier family protein C [Dioscorea cayenensis subsp. rotundata]|uniref:Mitochondrial substrate carrier family protein C n=1 Tax=Dioscorea cayennensis subsp. rotundata TaxID=55577 RepID=A0AB40C150_DIOCR|nr:mitochondrial substrate carrier family protein C [Dioscorea cayenensis subsp. rotundata]
MVSGFDPVDSFLRAVKDVISPIESGFLHAAKSFESKNFEKFDRVGRSGKEKPGCDSGFVLVGNEEKRKEAFVVRVPIVPIFESLFPNSRKNELEKRTEKEVEEDRDALPAAWSFHINRFFQALPTPLMSAGRCFNNHSVKDDDLKSGRRGSDRKDSTRSSPEEFRKSGLGVGEALSIELLLSCLFFNVVKNLQFFHQEGSVEGGEQLSHLDRVKIITGIIKGKKADVDGFFSSLMFARVGGTPPSLVGAASTVKEVGEERGPSGDREEVENTPQKLASGLLNIPLSNVERLRSTLSTVSLTELIEFIPQLGRSSADHPDKKKLFSVQDFFRYAEAEGRRFFEELDRDGDGQVTLEDLEIAMRKRRLPRRYAKDFLRRTRSHLFSKSIGWRQFLTLMEQKEPTILRAYTTLCLSKSGTLQKNQILTSLKSAGLPASEDNASAMMRYLNADTGGSISYTHFRNFMLLLPSERLQDDPRSIWFEAATVVAVPPPVEISAENVLKSALAGGLASALSTSLLHPIDSMKTRVQASTLSFPELVSRLPQIGIRGLYRGSIPAILGQFSSHGVRTGIFEASKLVLVNVAPTLPDIQVQSLASFCSTILGTAVRIPCEVLKQRLQAGLFDNVGEAIIGTLRQDGLKGFFRGTGATLCREVPFYVAGMCLYAEAKKAAQNLLNRELEPWETIAVGALSGGLAAVVTTPFDVMKTRTMTAPQGVPVSMEMIAFSILRQEGPLGLFKGAVPRFFWIAPLGAMNFAGYELARKAMDKSEAASADQFQEKRTTTSR